MVESIDLHLFILLCISLSFLFILLEEVDWLEESAILLCWNVSTVHHGGGKPRTSLAVLAGMKMATTRVLRSLKVTFNVIAMQQRTISFVKT